MAKYTCFVYENQSFLFKVTSSNLRHQWSCNGGVLFADLSAINWRWFASSKLCICSRNINFAKKLWTPKWRQMLVIMIQRFTCVMLIEVLDIGWDKNWECNHIYCEIGTNTKKLTDFYCRSVYIKPSSIGISNWYEFEKCRLGVRLIRIPVIFLTYIISHGLLFYITNNKAYIIRRLLLVMPIFIYILEIF